MPSADSGLIISFVVGYLGICAAIGVWAMRRTASAADFFLAGKSLGPMVVVMASISSVMSGFGFVGGPGLVYESGSSSLWMAFVCAFSLPTTYVLTGKRLRLLVEARPILTLPEAVSARYGGILPALAMSLAIFLGVIGYLGTQVLAIGTVLQAVLGIDLLTALAIGLGVLAFYSIAGGIVAGVYTDLFQGVLMLGAAIAVLAQCLKVGGGLESMTQTLWAMDPEYFGPWGTRGDLAALSWMLLFGLGAAGQPHFITKLMMLKDVRRLRWSALATGSSYLVLATLWMGVGLAMRTVVARGDHPELENPDLAAPTFLLYYTPELLAGLVFAGLLAAIMSTADSFLNLGAAAVVRDVPMAVLGRPLKGELFWSRVATGCLLLLSALFALYMESLIALLGTFGWGTFAAAIVPSICIGLNWKRATGQACVASIATSIALNFTLEMSARNGLSLLPPGLAVGAVALLASTVVFVLVSLATRPRKLAPDIDALMDV
ncbi:MAG: hypothetical protein OXN89_07555 [Bryobacterales bacterium]|nr:hypothetical protein [Bryobacterales bacterium]